MQEIWAIHGVYPTMAWTPDSREIVFWAGGKIHRLHVASGERSEIPFRVRTTRQVADAVRFPVDVHPDSFDVRMLRWVEVAPTGDRVAYSAMGHLWVRDLPDGTPRRVTSQEDHFEYYPSWSRDGRALVYVSWDDDALGAVRVVVQVGEAPVGGGAGRDARGRALPGAGLHPGRGHGGLPAGRRGAGSSPRMAQAKPGSSGSPSRGEASPSGSGGGSNPHFGAASDRVYFTGSDGGRGALQSVGLDGQDLRTHLRSQWAGLPGGPRRPSRGVDRALPGVRAPLRSLGGAGGCEPLVPGTSPRPG
jgi:hypothetical protein